MKMPLFFSIFFALFVFTNASFAQRRVLFRTPKIADLESIYYQKDSSAVAAYLHKECINQIFHFDDIPGQEGYKADLTHKYRIKIYEKEGIRYTKDSIILYVNDNLNIDKLTRFVVTTYNLENGKIVKSVLKEKDLTIDKSHKNYHVLHYEAKDVYIGSVVDIQYSIVSPYLYSLPNWNFQTDLPARWCSYEFSHPVFVDYNVTVNGFVTLKQKTNRSKNRAISTSTGLSHEYTEIQHNFSGTDIPAFVLEPYISSPLNYLGFLEFNLVGYDGTNNVQKTVAYTWKNIGQELLGSGYFGGRLMEGTFMENDIADLVAGLENSKEKSLAVYQHIQNKVTWNQNWGLRNTATLQSIYKKGVGNLTDVNLLLVSALKKAGLKAFPVMLSTRAHGFINPEKPSIRSFNYIIAGIEFEDGTLHFLDGTDPFGTLDILPEYCLNGQALRLGKYSNLIDLPTKKKEIESFVAKITLDEDGLAVGTLKYVVKDYAAHQLRQDWQEAGNQLRFFKRLELDNKNLLIQAGNVKNIEDNNKSVELDLLIRLKGCYKLGLKTATFTPVYMGNLEKNPFTAETRAYPIYFSSPRKKSFVMTIEIPKGYSVKTLPQSEIIRLPNKAGQFSYSASVIGEVVQIVYSYKLNATYLPSSMHTDLKAFYDAILRKRGESIVFKKD
ncbi:MAG: hypothetical protein JKY03_08480 [Aureispira sp.]|nr:hypothetical protein [Aureispira sp.]